MSEEKFQIIVKGKDNTDDISSWNESAGKVHITYSNGQTYSYNARNVEIKRSALSDETALNCFQYLKQIADTVGLHDSRAGNILLNHYNRMSFVNEESMLATFLSGKLSGLEEKRAYVPIYPFGFNLSQKVAVDNALENQLTIIEGPPGTGKTQTILNIIANAVMQGESVAVVSANNSATANVLEKLKKYQVDFIAAYLGNTENKQKFAESQKPLPDLSEWELSQSQENEIKAVIQDLYDSLKKMLSKKNELAAMRQQLDALELEYKHFNESIASDIEPSFYLKQTNSDVILGLWNLCEEYIERGKVPNLFRRLINRFIYGVENKKFYYLPPDVMISVCQKQWYIAKIKEAEQILLPIQKELEDFNFAMKMEEYSDLSVQIFRSSLAKKYKNSNRDKQKIQSLLLNSDAFIKEYPVILSTAYSLRSSLSSNMMYDYVIIDEASQVDIVTGALALSCAKKAVIVGDLKQLPNVVDKEASKKTDTIFTNSGLPEVYRYKNHSLLSAISALFPDASRVLLREHYRCHPKIIEFCNQKFYNGQLIVLTEPKSKRQPLIVYKTNPGNHARKHVNQRQIDVIKEEIIPQQHLDRKGMSIGIVTPYRNQTNALQNTFVGTGIQADTVDKFQGRENDIIVLSTVDNEISEFTDNTNRLNVAISRAIEQLIVVINGGDESRDTNIGDLIQYIEYNNLDIVQSEIYSVFDYLYKGYRDKCNELLSKHRSISEYESENLMYGLIVDVLAGECFSKFDVAVHVPLRYIIRNPERLNDDEKQYYENILTHVDFLVFDKLGKTPRLAIEVDGVSFHGDGTRQADRDILKNSIFEKYDFPLIRFKTNGSSERKKLVSKLNDIMGVN